MRPRPGFTAAAPYLTLLFGAGIIAAAILALNGGMFTYSLDDAYIHLALAERIAGGWYGINPGEASAPASSILWPFLLAPFARLERFDLLPLAINIACAAASLIGYTQIVRLALSEPARSTAGERPAAPRAGADGSTRRPVYGRRNANNRTGGGDGHVPRERPGSPEPAGSEMPLSIPFQIGYTQISTGILLALIPATNLLGLAFTGMEHSLQVLLCALIALGLAAEARSGRAPGWLALPLVLAPLLRYECLAVTAPALAYLYLRGHRRLALLAALLTALPLAAFSFFLHSRGLGWLPASVIAKTGFQAPASAPSGGLPLAVLRGLGRNLADPRAYLLLAALAALGWLALGMPRSAGGLLAAVHSARTARPARPALGLFLAAAAASLLHLLFGQFGWWERYEVYILTFVILLALSQAGPALRALAARPARLRLALLGFTLLYGGAYIVSAARTPLGASNIYQQQYQMHRFVVEYLRAPAAVNDLGWVAFRSPYPVLDLWGLASPDALRARSTAQSPDWMARLADERGAPVAMIYEKWFGGRLPETWTPAARLHLASKMTTAGDRVVTFFITAPEAAPRARSLLADFSQTLPPGVRLEILAGD